MFYLFAVIFVFTLTFLGSSHGGYCDEYACHLVNTEAWTYIPFVKYVYLNLTDLQLTDDDGEYTKRCISRYISEAVSSGIPTAWKPCNGPCFDPFEKRSVYFMETCEPDEYPVVSFITSYFACMNVMWLNDRHVRRIRDCNFEWFMHIQIVHACYKTVPRGSWYYVLHFAIVNEHANLAERIIDESRTSIFSSIFWQLKSYGFEELAKYNHNTMFRNAIHLALKHYRLVQKELDNSIVTERIEFVFHEVEHEQLPQSPFFRN